jgi:hypothetical protein
MNIQMGTIETSHAYLLEATKKAIAAEDDQKEWMFAILLLTQSLELTIKAVLESLHPLFIYDDIDNPQHTVSISKGFKRICNSQFTDITVEPKAHKAVDSLIKMRNSITHHRVDISIHHAKKIFCVAMELIEIFQSTQLDCPMSEILDHETMDALRSIDEFKWVVLKHAFEQVSSSEVPDKCLTTCPHCKYEYCVIGSGSVGVCYVCLEETDFNLTPSDNVFFCHRCKNTSTCIPHAIITLAYPDYCEGILVGAQYELIDDYTFEKVCNECLPEIKAEIEDKFLHLSNDYHWR